MGNFNNRFLLLAIALSSLLPQMTVIRTSNREAITLFLDHPDSQRVVLQDKHVVWPEGVTSLGMNFLFDPL